MCGIVGYIGRLEPLKGVEVLLRANELLPDEGFTVAIAGTGPEEYVEALRAGTNRRNMRFLGFVNPAQFFRAVDVVVVPSLWEEPAGRVIHEAYAYGVPVIASRLGGPPEMVVEGRTGYLFEAGDARALADALERVRRNGPGAMSRACFEESAKYDAEKIAGQYMEVLTEAAGTAAAPAAARATVAAPADLEPTQAAINREEATP
jgi:glycosyltransferase involved in cell wall biosynthesis